jgi:hypothetical protein
MPVNCPHKPEQAGLGWSTRQRNLTFPAMKPHAAADFEGDHVTLRLPPKLALLAALGFVGAGMSATGALIPQHLAAQQAG